jgi:DNA replication protein DnaC
MTVQTTMACAKCGGPTRAEPAPVELEWLMALVRPVCAPCSAVEEAEMAQREAAELEARRAEQREKRLRKVGVPDNLTGYGFENIDRPEGLDTALKFGHAWAVGELRGFGLIGPVGTGKTRVGIAAANEACWRTQAHWYSAPCLIAKLGSGGFESRERQKALDVLTGTGPLVLDDLDKARPTDYAAEQLFIAIDGRCDNGGQLGVTTNLQGPELARRWPQPYGVAIADRLSLLTWTKVGGESKRWKNKGTG